MNVLEADPPVSLALGGSEMPLGVDGPGDGRWPMLVNR